MHVYESEWAGLGHFNVLCTAMRVCSAKDKSDGQMMEVDHECCVTTMTIL